MGPRFRADSRGVSEVVGAVLLLGFLVLALSLYQVSVVPNQNAAAEFDHNQQVEDEMVDIRNAILEARSTGKDRYSSVTLGTRYQDRTLAVNPPSPTGTIETVKQRNVSVVERGGDDDPLGLAELRLENQFLEYTPRYYEYQQAGTIRFENTVAYHEYENSNVLLTEQTLLRGETVSLVPLEGEFRKNGQGRVTIDPIPGLLKTVRVDDPNVTVPTELPREDWEELLAEELDDGETISVTDGNLTLALNGSYDVAYAPIGVNRPPAEGQRSSENNEINPAAPGDVQLVGVDWNNDKVEMTFRNSGDNTTFTDGRINFFTGTSDPSAVEAVNAVSGGPNPRGTNWQIGDDFADLDPAIQLEGGGSTTSIEFDFDTNLNDNQDFFIVTLTLGSGQQATYFVGGEYSFSGGSGTGSLEYAGELQSNGDGNFRFRVSNPSSSETVTVTGLRVDDTLSDAITSGGNSPRVTFSDGDVRTDITTNGNLVSFSTNADIDPNQERDIEFDSFTQGGTAVSRTTLENLVQVGSAAQADLTVTLELDGGNTATFYFEDQS